jgi:putative sigma-54 modulation protein
MRIHIYAPNFVLTEALRDYVERRFQFAVSWAHTHVRKVSVRLGDINGPRGGDDKSCRIQIPIKGGKDIVIENVDSDLYAAIDRAFDRAARAIGRHLDRSREYSHQRIHLFDYASGEGASRNLG